jgi:hypothetical protein
MRAEQFRLISVIDEAIDTASMPIDTMIRYHDSRDIALIEPYIKPTPKPTIYHVRVVPHSLWQSYVMGGGDSKEIRHRRAFMCGVERVENLYGRDGIATSWAPTRRLSEKLTIMTEDECNERFFPYEVEEIGAVIFSHSFLPLRMQLQFPLPSLCVEALVARPFLSAAPNQSDASTKTSEPHSNGTGPLPEATASI